MMPTSNEVAPGDAVGPRVETDYEATGPCVVKNICLRSIRFIESRIER
jgi:hypothetical protein